MAVHFERHRARRAGRVAFLALALVAVVIPRPDVALARLVVGLDAVGLGLFAVVGATRAAEAGIGIVGGAVVGTVSAIGGGLLRDVLADDVPQVFRPGSRLYVVPALLGSLIVGVAAELDIDEAIAATAAAAVVITTRLLALRFGWNAPLPRGRGSVR